MKCDLCGSSVKVVGHTTKHYEPDPDWRDIAKELAERLGCLLSHHEEDCTFFEDGYDADCNCIQLKSKELFAKYSKLFAEEERKGEG